MRAIHSSNIKYSHNPVQLFSKKHEQYRIMKVFLILLLTCGLSKTVQIHYIKVPQALKNDSGQPAILDCNYAIRPDDTELVVKWFLNNDLVYQWVPPQKPQSLGLLKDKIDLSFKTTADPKTVHRAIKIINPTTDVAGEYKCFVSTFADEDFSVKSMIVFEPEKDLELYRSQTDGVHVNFTCLAREVYPQANLIVYRDKKQYNQTPLEGVEWNTRKHDDGKYSLWQTSTIRNDLLDFGSLIFCELRIPGTGYVKRRSLLYYPEAALESRVGPPNIEVSLTISSVLFLAVIG